MSINFKLVSEFQTIHRRPFEVTGLYTAGGGGDDGNILNPTSTRPLVDGEWLELTTDYKMARGGDNVLDASPAPDDEAAVPSFAYFAERGRYEVQAIMKGPFLYLAPYEADTMIFDSAAAQVPTAVGDPLSVWDVSINSIIRRALGLATAGGYIVGYVTRMPANNNNWLRFIHTA